MKPKILIGIIANEAARYSLFTACVLKLDVSEIDTTIEVLIGGDWCSARNDLVRMTLQGEPVYENGEIVRFEPYTHLWFMDDDHAFPPSLLKRLLSHDKALVNPLCCARLAPFPLVTYAGKLADGTRYLPLDLAAGGTEGLVQLEAAGCAGMLIRRDVLEALSDPWFEHTERSEDILFCEKAKAAKFVLYADLEARLGHITTAVVWPAVDDGEWKTGLTIGRDLNLFVKIASEWEEEADGDDTVPPFVAPDPPTLAGPLAGVERVEIWLNDDGVWEGRWLDMEGKIGGKFGGFTQEPAFLEWIEKSWPDVAIHHVQSELYDSRLNPYGPPKRLWAREVGQ